MTTLNHLLQKFPQSIRFRLIAAFVAVAVIAIILTLYTWYSASHTERQINSFVANVLPLVNHSQRLSRELTSYTKTVADLVNVASTEELNKVGAQLKSATHTIRKDIADMGSFDFEPLFVSRLTAKVERLIDNLDTEVELTGRVLEQHSLLMKKLTNLASQLKNFQNASSPFLTHGYTQFLMDSRAVADELILLVKSLERGERKVNLKQLNEKLNTGFDTLFNTSAKGMRTNLEMVAITYLVSSLFLEAASIESLEKLREINDRYIQTQPLIQKIQQALATTTTDTTLLQLARPILNLGEGNDSIFRLRIEELKLKREVRELSQTALGLSDQLSQDVHFLSSSSQKFSEEFIANMRKTLGAYKLLSICASLGAILLASGIGLLYVEKYVIRRLVNLQKTMRKQAQGADADIPVDSYDDEISHMSRALEQFVSQRVQAEERQRRLVSSLNEAQQMARIGNCERNHLTRQWHWSKGFYHIIGYTEEELPSSEENFWKIVHRDDRLQVELFCNTLSSSSEPSEIEFRLIAKDGLVMTVKALWKLVEDNTSPFTQHGSIQDISERKRVEEDLLKIRKMESISVLAGGIAHDFNNLLTGILGNIALATKLISSEHNAHEHLKLSEKAALRARNLTQQLLVFSSGGNPIRSITYLPDILKETANFSLAGSNVKCEFYFEEQLWPVDVDSTYIHQIVQNLLVNSNQAMPQGGTITITCYNRIVTRQQLTNLPAGPYVNIVITDTGEGIPLEHLEKIFDPYYTTKGFYTEKGSGLGLAIVHSIVSKHGGSISVDSTVGEGTSFHLMFPAIQAEELSNETTQEDPPDEEQLHQGSGAVLIMDDEEVILHVLRQMLMVLGYTVYSASDGKEALATYEKLSNQGTQIAAVIMDLTIPGGLGAKETVTRLHEKHPNARVIVSSGYSNDPAMQNYTSYGFSDTITKPYQLKELSRVLHRVVTA